MEHFKIGLVENRLICLFQSLRFYRILINFNQKFIEDDIFFKFVKTDLNFKILKIK